MKRLAEEAEALAHQAHPGKWKYKFNETCLLPHHIMSVDDDGEINVFAYNTESAKRTGEFIAASRELVPTLAGHVKRLVEEVERLRLSDKEADCILERWDDTPDDIKRGIVLKLVLDRAEMLEQIESP